VVVLAVVIAGCSSPRPSASDTHTSTPAVPPPRPGAVAPTFRTPLLLGDIPDALAEPSVAVGPDGSIVVTTQNLHVWRSHDGSTFEAVGEPDCETIIQLGVCPPGFTDLHPRGLVGPGDSDIAFAPNGTLWWAGLFAANASVPLQSSTDLGTTWSSATDVANGAHSDREWINVDGNGTARLVWTQFDGSGPYTVYRRDDHGRLSPLVRLPGQSRLKGPLVRGGNGTLYVPQSDLNGVWLSTSHDDGATWKDVLVADISSNRTVYLGSPTWIWPTAAVDDAGTIYVTWAVDDQVTNQRPARELATPIVHFASSTDGGATWKGMVLSTPLHAAIMPWIVAGAAGQVAVAWYESASPLPSEEFPSVWDVRLVQSVDGDAASPTFLGGKANVDPVHIGGICTAGGGLGGCLGPDRSQGDFFELAIGRDGLPRAAWAGDSPTRVQHTQVWFGGVATGTPLR
jgi:hypothetical protein